MTISRVALIYDDVSRPDTTGTHCLRALKQLCDVRHFRPDELQSISSRDFDLYLNIDDGLRYHLPASLRPCAWWVIDTHMDPSWAEEKGGAFDWLFAAQLDGATALRNTGIRTEWLPLACNPHIHKPYPREKLWDVCFLGNLASPERQEWLELVQHHFPNSLIGQRYFDEFAKSYSEAKIGFNRSIKNDVNMRVFETLACGPLLITNDLRSNGQDELFKADRHFVVYTERDELLDKLVFYLKHDKLREKIAISGYREVLSRHTYLHRMQQLLGSISSHLHTTLNVGREGINPAKAVPLAVTDASFISGSFEIDSVDFIIKTFLRPQALLRLLKSILCFYPGAHVTIVDDGCLQQSADLASGECRKLLEANPQFRMHSLPFAAGVTAGRNLLVDRTTRPFLLLLMTTSASPIELR